jgi:N-acetylglutamate synthase-like GNAT family acetyltransferase
MTEPYIIRPAQASEEPIIKSMIRQEQLDPFNVHWQNFLVAVEGERIIGIGQVKPYRSGRELGSLVVVVNRRQTGVAGSIINALIAHESGPLLLFCLAYREPFYSKFGFRRVGLADISGSFKLKYAFGVVFTRFMKHHVIVMKRQAG